MQRVMIVGGPGSGKSTLARALGARTGLPVYHMDHIHWQAGWIERAGLDKGLLALAVQARDRWIFEGGLSRTYADRIARADTFIWLDLPVALRLWRVLRRSVTYWGNLGLICRKGVWSSLGWKRCHFGGSSGGRGSRHVCRCWRS